MKKLLTIAMIFGLAAFGRAENGSGINDIPGNEGYVTVKHTPKAPTKTAVTTKKEAYREEIRMVNLPKFTQQYMKENFPVRQVKQVSKVITGEGVGYQVGIKIEGVMNVIRFDSKGEPVDL